MFRKSWRRFLHHLARHSFPSGVRVFFHRLRGVSIGNNVYIGLDVHIDDDNTEMIIIEDNVYIAPECMLLTHKRDMSMYSKGMWVGDCPFFVSSIELKKGSHIGTRSLIFPGVTIGEGAIIGAYSLVTKDIPAYSLAIGIPAKIIKQY